ncbi:MAG: 30S ribosomal protein S20 [Bacilli bacterium]|nr:30S ribosomal protein S20 [Bacilli bacterium]
MPNMKNAEKKILVDKKREETNNKYVATMKNSIKKVEKAVASNDKEKATEALKVAIKSIDKAAQNGTAKKNTCSRNKSRLTKKVNAME